MIKVVPFPHIQTIVDCQPYPTLVTPEDTQDDNPGHVEVASYSNGLEGYYEKTGFENNLIPTLLSHDLSEGLAVCRFSNDNNDGGGKCPHCHGVAFTA
jgi:hypothetical protein